MPGCRVVGAAKPIVWKDDYGWRCEQTVECLRCSSIWDKPLAEETSWQEAMQASARATTRTAHGGPASESQEAGA